MEDIRLNLNENPLGPNPEVVRAIIDAATMVNRYGSSSDLEHAIAAKHGIDPGQVILGNGSIELLDTVAHSFLGPENNAVTPRCSFAAYSLVTERNGSRLVRGEVKDGFGFVDGVIDAVNDDTGVVWFANPNNPTGILTSRSEVARMLGSLNERIVVVIDEAYMDFVGDRESSIDLIDANPNLLISRTFSKAHGIAGLRIGFMVGQEDLISRLKRTRLPLSVAGVAIAAARAALDDDTYLERTREHVQRQRQIVCDSFRRLGIDFLPSETNFVSFQVEGADRIRQALERDSIFVKELNEFGMPGYLRVSLGSAADNGRLINSLTRILKGV